MVISMAEELTHWNLGKEDSSIKDDKFLEHVLNSNLKHLNSARIFVECFCESFVLISNESLLV